MIISFEERKKSFHAQLQMSDVFRDDKLTFFFLSRDGCISLVGQFHKGHKTIDDCGFAPSILVGLPVKQGSSIRFLFHFLSNAK